MEVSMPFVKRISLITCFTNSYAMNKEFFSGVSSQRIYGMTHIGSAITSNVCLSDGSKNGATHHLSSFGDYRMRVCYPRNLRKSAVTSSGNSILPAVTSVPSLPAMVERELTGMSSRTGVVLTAVLQRTMTKN